MSVSVCWKSNRICKTKRWQTTEREESRGVEINAAQPGMEQLDREVQMEGM